MKGSNVTNTKERLVKIEGQVRGVMRMIEKNRDYAEILHQIKAIRKALKSVEQGIIEQNLGKYFGPGQPLKKILELVNVSDQ